MLRGVCLEVVCSHPLLDSLEAAGKEGGGGGESGRKERRGKDEKVEGGRWRVHSD